ncbi:hypothetical protein Plo01_42870 [Planobispora longispora]|uniref:Uncharacterized protein n=1 Tax=Planobispora longispora TaxID=28887 RepID=A0A8J3RMR5_9ACTN|nr:hypothetical protein Plo01_42870 [Planobispora longispora]
MRVLGSGGQGRIQVGDVAGHGIKAPAEQAGTGHDGDVHVAGGQPIGEGDPTRFSMSSE